MTDSRTPSVALIGGGPGAWDLITVRGMRRLQEADVILADHLGPSAELDKLCDVSNKEIVDVSKLPYGKQVAQEKINDMLIDYAAQGKRVVRLKGGDPYVFGRGFEEKAALAAAGISVEEVPGVTSAISVPAAADVPVTQRGITHAFTVISGHVPPDSPKSLNNWEALAHIGGTLVVIMGVKNARAIAQTLMSYGLNPDTPAAVIQEGMTDQQRQYRCTVETLADTMAAHEIKPPAVYVIGEVAGLEL